MRLPKRLVASIRQLKRLPRRWRRSEYIADYPLVSTEKLRFADTDRNGHISNAVFAVCCQNARMELLMDSERLPFLSEVQFVIGRLDLEFRGEMHWPGTVRVGTRVVHVGRCSVRLAQALFVADRCVAVSKSTAILIAKDTRRPEPLPPEFAEFLQGLAGHSDWAAIMKRGAQHTLRAWSVRA